MSVTGDDVMMAPNVQLYTATHPTDPIIICDQALEYAKPIKVLLSPLRFAILHQDHI